MDTSEPAPPPGTPEPSPEDRAAAERPARDAASTAASFATVQAAVEAGLSKLHQSLERRTAVDKMRETQLERLAAQIEDQRGGILATAIRPLVHGLIKLRDEVSRRAEAFAARKEATPSEALVQALRDVPEDIDALLQAHGVAAFREPTDRFDPRRQTAVVLRRTTRDDLVGTIVSSLRPGFEQGNEVLQKERVEVWVEDTGEARKDDPTADAARSACSPSPPCEA